MKDILLGLLFMLGIHPVFMGYSTWDSQSKWQGATPISLILFGVVIFGFVINAIGLTSVGKV
ncbi:hypothetical protein V5097_10680 [Arenibacter palladensis]|uniref:hypothetical protein n=1 Tax=Arenibacter palladensis TaxID=237373 RepID=UPI002FD1FEFC